MNEGTSVQGIVLNYKKNVNEKPLPFILYDSERHGKTMQRAMRVFTIRGLVECIAFESGR